MELKLLIKKVIGETVSFPVLFAPTFLAYFLNGLLASNRLISALGGGGSLFASLLIFALLIPAAAGITISLDRKINSGKYPSLIDSFEEIKPKYLTLIGVNLAANLAAVLGLFLFIIPGIYLLVKFVFVSQEVLLGGKTNLQEALESSWNHTNNLWGTVFQIILIFQLPPLIFSLSLTGLPPGWGMTLNIIMFTIAQTWLTLVITHLYVKITRGN
ncbi:MAG: hypothetical protein ACOC7Z_01280 [Candidatus Bipolaricaulota bacterium]